MSRFPHFIWCIAMFGISSGLSGCGTQTAPPPVAHGVLHEPAQDDHSNHDHSDHDHGGHDHGNHAHVDDAEISKALSALTTTDRTAAAAQKTCPVTGEPLGSMGTPPKVTVNGKEVFICCAGCEGELQDNPVKYLAELKR